MLQTLSIRDFVIVDTLNLDFEQGFTVLTGETGAGKSILIDALSLAIGARGEGGVIRAGCEKAEISASFYIAKLDELKAWMQENEIPNDDNQLLCRRVIYADGRSRAFINGQPATIQQLRDVGEFLVDIYSQNAHHSLLKLATQREIFDSYCNLTELAQQTAAQFKHWQTLHQRRLEMEQNASKYADELAELPPPPDWKLTVAPVIARDPASWNRRFRIGKGANDGIFPGAAVMAGNRANWRGTLMLVGQPAEETVKVHLRSLRQKLKAAGAPDRFIENVYGLGYRLNPHL